MVDLELLSEAISKELLLLGRTRKEVIRFFELNPEVLDGADYEDPIARYLRNVLGVKVIVGRNVIRCGRWKGIPLPLSVRDFISWYDNVLNEPNLGSGVEGQFQSSCFVA